MTARYGYGPNGRALKKDGTERKARTTLTLDESFAQIEAQRARIFERAGKAVLSEMDGFAGFNDGLAKFKAHISEARRYATEEKRAALKARLEAEIALIEDKGAVAASYLPEAEKAQAVLSSLYSTIGEKYQQMVKDGEIDDAEDIIRELISDEVLEMVENSADPENDPYVNFRGTVDNDPAEDDDTL